MWKWLEWMGRTSDYSVQVTQQQLLKEQTRRTPTPSSTAPLTRVAPTVMGRSPMTASALSSFHIHKHQHLPLEPEIIGSPPHYTQGDIECIHYLKDNLTREGYLGFLEGNVKKYLHRWKHKGKPEQDLAKATWYLNKLTEETNIG